MQAAEVPIAVPISWRKYISPHSNMLFDIANFTASFTASKGTLSGRWRLYSQIPTTSRACLVSMLVYIESASAVRR